MKIVAFVPIKLKSQRLPHKNILLLGNNPLCSYIFDTLLTVKNQGYIDEVHVYCSDPKIKNYINDKIIFTKRPSKLDTNEMKGLEIYKSFMNNVYADVYILCHATSPFIKAESIIKGITSVTKDNYDSAFSVQKIKTFSWYKNKVLNYNLNDIPRTQDIEPIYIETSAFYVFKRNVLICNRRIGIIPKMIITDIKESIDIDTKDDFDMAIAFYKLRSNLYFEYHH